MTDASIPPVVTERLRGQGWWTAVRVIAPVGALLVEGWPALIGALCVQEGGLWLAGRLVAKCERRFARRLFLAAYAVRVAIAVPAHYFAKLGDGNGALFADDYTNDLVGEWLVRIARGEGIAIFPGHQHLLDGVYPYLLMASHAIFGFTPLVPKLLNGSLAALCAVLVFELTRQAFGKPAAVLAALGAALLPTLVIWSVAALKESAVLLVSLLGLRILQFVATAPRQHPRQADALVALLAVLVLLLDLRSTTAAILLSLLVVVLVARSQYRPRPWQLGFTTLALVFLVGGGIWFTRARTSNRPVSGVVEDVVLQIRHRRAQEAANANSQMRTAADSLNATGSEIPTMEAASDATPFSVSGDILEPLGYALLSPAPWQARSLTELGASAEMPIWYVLLAASCLAWQVRTPEPGQRLFVVCLVLYGIANWLVLAASEGNVGNLLRHRLMLDPVLLMLGTAGLDWLWRTRRPTASSPSTRLVSVGSDG